MTKEKDKPLETGKICLVAVAKNMDKHLMPAALISKPTASIPTSSSVHTWWLFLGG